MKKINKIVVFLAAMLVACSLLTLSAFAASPEAEGSDDVKIDMNLGDPKEAPLEFGERLEYALQGTVTGILMVFGVLTLLTLILYGSKYVFYDIPNKKKQPKKADKSEKAEASAPVTEALAASPVAAEKEEDEGELVAVITAAIAAMLEGEEYKNEFVGGFRVVSFNRNESTAWNRK